MKRIRVFMLIGAALLFAMGVILVLALSRPNTISFASLPPYPSATDAQTSNVKTTRGARTQTHALIETLTFKTTDGAQLVHDYYGKWFAGRGWRSNGQSQGETRYSSEGLPDFSNTQVRWRPGSLLPAVVLSRHIYRASVRATRLDQTTFVWVQLDDEAP